MTTSGGRQLNPIFGEPWDAPACEGAPHVPVPVGELCAWCQTPILAGERGLLIPAVRNPGRAATEPWHRECMVREMTRSTCTCLDTGTTSGRPTPAQRRAEAVVAWEMLTGGRVPV